MRYRQLGDTGLRVSEIGFGAEWIGGMTQEQVDTLVDELEGLGMNIVDCWMADPEIRAHLGHAVSRHRDKWVVQGHFGSTWQGGQYVRTRDMDKAVPAFEQLLDCFNGHIELGMVHYVDKPEEFEQILNGPFFEYVEQQKREGHIDHIGLSTHNTDVARLAAESGKIEMIMFSINPAYDMMPPTDDLARLMADDGYEQAGEGMNVDSERAALYEYCESHGIGLTVMKPFAGGRLFEAERSPFGVELTPVQCLHYCLTRPAVASVLAGYKSVEQARECCAYEEANDDERDYMRTLAKAPKHSFGEGYCIYCGHCQPCAMSINIAQVNKFADLAEMQDGVPESVLEHYRALDRHASDCIGCKACEPNCPFGVKIADKMQKTAELFGF